MDRQAFTNGSLYLSWLFGAIYLFSNGSLLNYFLLLFALAIGAHMVDEDMKEDAAGLVYNPKIKHAHKREIREMIATTK